MAFFFKDSNIYAAISHVNPHLNKTVAKIDES